MHRAAFHDLAQAQGAGFAILALTAPIEVLRRRVLDRLAAGGDASEASLAVLERQRSSWEPLSPAEQRMVVMIDSAGPPPLDDVLARIAELTACAGACTGVECGNITPSRTPPA